MSNKILDSEMIDKDQDIERLKQLRQEKVSGLDNQLLKAIAQKESSGGANIEHKKMSSGMHKGMQAGGAFGLMPISVQEEFARSPELREKYPNMPSDPALITEDINNNPEMDKEIAASILRRRLERLGNEKEAVYSWHHGVQGALNARNRGSLDQDAYTKEIMAELLKNKLRGVANE